MKMQALPLGSPILLHVYTTLSVFLRSQLGFAEARAWEDFCVKFQRHNGCYYGNARYVLENSKEKYNGFQSRKLGNSSKTHTSTMISHPADKLADRFYLKRLTLFSHLFI